MSQGLGVLPASLSWFPGAGLSLFCQDLMLGISPSVALTSLELCLLETLTGIEGFSGCQLR